MNLSLICLALLLLLSDTISSKTVDPCLSYCHLPVCRFGMRWPCQRKPSGAGLSTVSRDFPHYGEAGLRLISVCGPSESRTCDFRDPWTWSCSLPKVAIATFDAANASHAQYESRTCDFRSLRKRSRASRKSHLRLSYCECVSLARQFQPSHCYFFNAKRNDAGQCNSPRVVSDHPKATPLHSPCCLFSFATASVSHCSQYGLAHFDGGRRLLRQLLFFWVRATHGASWAARLARQGASTQRLRDPVPPGLRRGFRTQGAAKPTPGRRNYRLAVAADLKLA